MAFLYLHCYLSEISFGIFVIFSSDSSCSVKEIFFSNQELQMKKQIQIVKKKVLQKENAREFKSLEVQVSTTLNYLLEFTK